MFLKLLVSLLEHCQSHGSHIANNLEYLFDLQEESGISRIGPTC